jgi:4-aminobutyrate aminotransferase-like enzyme
MEDDGNFYSTYGWHPRSVDVAITTLQYIIANEKSLFTGLAATSEYFRSRLGAMDFGDDAEVRIRGLAIGVDLRDEDRVGKLARRCRRKGLLVSDEGETLLLIPALNVSRKAAERGLDILEDCIS